MPSHCRPTPHTWLGTAFTAAWPIWASSPWATATTTATSCRSRRIPRPQHWLLVCVCVCVCLSVFCINILTYCTFNAYCLLLHACSRAVHGFRLKLLSPSLSSLWFYPSSQHDPLHMRPFALHVPGNCAGGGDTKWRRPPFQGHGGEGHPGPHACKCKSLSPQHLRI